MRVQTDAGAYVGSLDVGSGGLRELVDGDRTYLGLWNAACEGASGVEEFVALHKAVICSVVEVGKDVDAASLPREV